MQAEVAVVGSGVVGSATALELARRGAAVALLEAEPEPGLAASGTNSGILHTGFDSVPGELETELILRSAALRDPVLEALRVPVLRCGALMRPADGSQRDAVAALAAERGAQRRRGVASTTTARSRCRASRSPIRSPTRWRWRPQPNATARSFAPAFESRGFERSGGEIIVSEPGGDSLAARLVVNCAGLGADEVARLAGDDSFEVYPRKGEFLVFDPPGGERLERILLPVPSEAHQGRPGLPHDRRQGRGGPDGRRPARTRTTGRSVPRPGTRSFRKASAMYPPLEDAEPVAAYAGLRPAGRGVNYLIGPSDACPGPRQRGGDPLHGPHRLAGDRRAGRRDRRRARRRRSAPSGRSSPGRRAGFAGPWWRRTAEYRAQLVETGGGMSLLLGIDEGTSAVKAVLFDADLRPVKEARREKALAQPSPGWVEQDAEEVLAAVVDAVAELLADAPGRSWPAGSTTRASRCWPGTPTAAGPLTPIVTWQDKRSQEVLDRARGRWTRRRGARAQRHAARPLLLGRQADLAARARRGGRAGRETPAPLRLGTVDSFLCDRLGAGFATDPSTASRTQLGAPELDPALLEIFGVPTDALPAIADTAGDLGVLRHDSWPVELPLRARCPDQQAALAGAGCVEPGLVEGDLRHRRLRPRPRGRRAARAGRRPAPDRRLADRRAGRVGDRRGRVHRRGPARVAQPRPRARGRPGRARRRRGRGRGRGRRAGAAGARRRRRPLVGVRGARA